MKHLVFLVHILSFMLGCAAILLSVFAYKKYKSRMVIYYILMLLSWLAVLSERTVYFYMLAGDEVKTGVDMAFWVVSSIGSGLMMVFLPFFIHDLFQIKLSGRKRNLFKIAAVLPVTGFILYAVMPYKLTFVVVTSVLVFLMLFYCYLIAFFNYKNISDAEVRKVARTFLIMFTVFFPILVIDVRIMQTSAFQDILPYGLLSIPVFYLLWNVFSIYYGIRYFEKYVDAMNVEQKEYVRENIESTLAEERFFSKYKITGREKEVIGLLAKGLSYARISEELVISVTTARTHIYNIYQKTGASNKVELINLMKNCTDSLIQKY